MNYRKVKDLVSDIKNGEIKLPPMQRAYVWKSTQVTDLLDSLYRCYPAGNILLWETPDSNVETRNFAVTQDNTYTTRYLLLDGQQRLTSLKAVMTGECITVKDSKKPIDIYFNLEHDDKAIDTDIDEQEEDEEIDTAEDEMEKEQTKDPLADYKKPFIVANSRIRNDKKWVSVTEVLQSNDITPILKKIGICDLNDPLYEKYRSRLDRLQKIKEYPFHLVTLGKDLSHEDVTDIFIRVNSKGIKLKSSDLALAQITTKWEGSLKLFENFLSECQEQKKWDLEMGILIRTLVVIITGQCKFKPVTYLTREKLEKGWEATKEAICFALSYLTENFNIENEELLSSPYFIVFFSYLVFFQKREISNQDTALLQKWFVIANAKGRYSHGSSETLLNEDISYVRQKNLHGLLESMSLQLGLDITSEHLKGKTKRTGYFKTIFSIMRHNRARDWQTNLVISLEHQGKKDKIEFHHIFPQNILKKHYISKEIDDIANLTFLGKVTNIKINDDLPEKYLSRIVEKCGEKILRDHCIPLDRNLWKLENYISFLEARRSLLVELFQNHLNSIEKNI